MKRLGSLIAGCGLIALLSNRPFVPPSREAGYLPDSQTSDVIHIVPPPPSPGDARYRADMAIFRATRSFEGSARWTLAQADDELTTAGLLHAFRCALGVTLTPENAPRLTMLIARANSDAARAVSAIKARYRHKRPFQTVEGDVCLSSIGKAALELNPDYPSGHAALGWEAGLILAELVPNSASEVLARARAFGQSRVVCGVHNASAVEAGWMTATAVFAMQNSSPIYIADLNAARTELANWDRIKLRPEGCGAEAALLSKNPY